VWATSARDGRLEAAAGALSEAEELADDFLGLLERTSPSDVVVNRCALVSVELLDA
jgi:hypothetical protein